MSFLHLNITACSWGPVQSATFTVGATTSVVHAAGGRAVRRYGDALGRLG